MNASSSPILSLTVRPQRPPVRSTPELLDALDKLRLDLIDLAYQLDTRNACVASDVAITTAARIAEICQNHPPR